MIPTTQDYKDLVYSQGKYKLFSRQFVPDVSLTLADMDAASNMGFAASSQAPYSQLGQLSDNLPGRARPWGTLEDYQFLLNGVPMLMPDTMEDFQMFQNGWVSGNMSNEDGVFTTPEELRVIFSVYATTGGHITHFDPSYDSVPVDFDVIYYRNGSEVDRDEVRGNTSYQYEGHNQVQEYNVILLRFYNTSRPYRTIHVLEDMPGIFLSYTAKDIVSMTLTQEVDPLSEEAITGEINLNVSNLSHTFDILNDTGLDAYLKQYQRADVYLNLIFPDLSEEKVHLGQWELSDWKAEQSEEAQFIFQDNSATLSRKNFIACPYQDEITLYDLATLILTDAGASDYALAERLRQYKVNPAALGVGTHKEALRRIAQASGCVLAISSSGQIQVRDISPLREGKNLCLNGNFVNQEHWWPKNVTFEATPLYAGSYSVHPGVGEFLLEQYLPTTPGHQYYIRVYVQSQATLEGIGGTAYLDVEDVHVTPNLAEATLIPNSWVVRSAIITATTENALMRLHGNLQKALLWFDGFMCLDLTEIYGDSVPDASWCDKNIIYFSDILSLPPHTWENESAFLQYNTLLDSPAITKKSKYSLIKVNAYTPRVDEISNAYSAKHEVHGTEEIEITFSNPITGQDTSVEVVNGECLDYTIYTQGARVKVRADGEVTITIRGRSISFEAVPYTRSWQFDPQLTRGAPVHEMTNTLVSTAAQAQYLITYMAYWDSMKFQYTFEWRQDPSIEVLDILRVQDDFGNNRQVLCTRRDLDYSGGTLSGSSEGVG